MKRIAILAGMALIGISGLLLCALEIWLLSIGGLICVVGELLTLPGRLLIGIGSLLINLAPR